MLVLVVLVVLPLLIASLIIVYGMAVSHKGFRIFVVGRLLGCLGFASLTVYLLYYKYLAAALVAFVFLLMQIPAIVCSGLHNPRRSQ